MTLVSSQNLTVRGPIAIEASYISSAIWTTDPPFRSAQWPRQDLQAQEPSTGKKSSQSANIV
jgi:hypothetical protein